MNKIGFINGSPRRQNSCSQLIIDYLSKKLEGNALTSIHIASLKPSALESSFTNLLDCDVLVVVSPLYVDSLPSHLLDFLSNLDYYQKNRPNSSTHLPVLYGFINCGFMDGHQNHIALSILENFAQRMHFTWGGGIGLGSGEMFKGQFHTMPAESKMQKPIFNALDELINAIEQQTALHTPHQLLLVSQDFSTRLFILMGNLGWVSQAKGVRHKLYNRPYLHHK